MRSAGLSPNPFITLKLPSQFRAKRSSKTFSAISARLDNSQSPDDKQLNLSVLRFTLGIPGLDESYLPRWIGYGFGSLLLLNHFVGSNSAANTTPAQLRTEALGLSLAAFSVALPYLGKFLKGATRGDQAILPEGTEQIFLFSQDISDTQKEDLAWATYILLRNTSTTAVVGDELCVRGYWNIPDEVSTEDRVDWFKQQIVKIGISELNGTLYFPQISGSGLWEMLPKGTCSILVQPVVQIPNPSGNEVDRIVGLVLLASSVKYAYSEKDRAWIRAIANKFRGKTMHGD